MAKLTWKALTSAKVGAAIPDPAVPGLRYRVRGGGIFAELRYKVGPGKWKAEALGKIMDDDEYDGWCARRVREADLPDKVSAAFAMPGGQDQTENRLWQVREDARAMRRHIAAGNDPRSDQAGARPDTLGAIADEYLKHTTARERTMVERRRHLTRDWAPLRDRPAASLTRGEISTRLFALKADHGPIASNRARSTLHAALAWAFEHGRIETMPAFPPKVLKSEPRRERVLSLDELRAVWQAAGDGDHGAIVRLLMLTGQRREEVGGMLWAEIDLDRALWSLPGERTKNGRAHVVPLSRAAVDILAGIPRTDRANVFGNGAGAYSGWSRSKRRLDGRAGIAPWTLHDLRRSWATHVAKLTGRVDVVELALNHRSGVLGGVAGTYIRATFLDERTAAMQRWADHLLQPAAPDNVVQLTG